MGFVSYIAKPEIIGIKIGIRKEWHILNKFYQKVDKRSRKAMIEFLKNHFRYHTANSWNVASSYAHNMKIHYLDIDSETRGKLYDLIECRGFYDTINDLIRYFGEEHNWLWQAGFNGRSDGYLVLYQGERVPSGYKSYCPSCGQLNWTNVSENSGKCGRCKDDRLDFSSPHMITNVFPGRGTDRYEDFEDWDMCELKDRVELLQSFARLADDIVKEAIYLADTYEAAKEEYMVVKTRPVMINKTEIA